MDKWFANKGQVVQAVLAMIAVVIASIGCYLANVEKHPSLTAATNFFAAATVGTLISIALFWRYQRTANRTPDSSTNQRLPIEILTPLNYGEVGFRRTVGGSVRPALSRVQVWVLAGDGFWYRQGPVKVDGCLWSVECWFGGTQVMDKPSGDYQIIAIADATIREERLPILPDIGIKSEIIKVRRTHN